MLSALPVISSVLLVLLLGQVLSRTILPEPQFWQGVSRLCYWVLFPAMLFKTIAQSDFSMLPVDAVLSSLLLGLAAIIIISYMAGRVVKLPAADLSSLMQGSFRHNGFMALTVISGLYGAPGLALGTLCIAVLVPPSNVVAVITMVLLNQRGKQASIRKLLAKELARNPLIIGILLGLAAKFSPLALPDFLYVSAGLVGEAALPILLLGVGAGVKISASLTASVKPLLLAILAKGLLFPALLVGFGLLFGVNELALAILAIFGVMPTAVSSYALAQELDGNVPLMAEIISLQTLCCLTFLLLWLAIVG